jgi:tetratricopeptide (TPR) repeat protein
MDNKLLISLAICLFAGFTPIANAQLVDDIELRREGRNAIAQIKFTTPVQYSKSISARALDLIQVFYTVLPHRDQISDINSERHVDGTANIPSMTVADEPVHGAAQANPTRKLVVRFATPVRFKVRQGRGNRSIEIVLEGLATSVNMNLTSAPAPEPPAAARYVVTLQSTSAPGQPLSASVPASLQDYQVFTATRIVDGKAQYDTNLGFFSNEKDAQTALGFLTKLFPAAVIVDLQPHPPTIIKKAQQSPAAEPDVIGTATPKESKDIEITAAGLLSTAQSAFDGGDYGAAIESLNKLLNMAPNASSRRAQELAGLSSLNAGENARAASEFELFLKLYPVGSDSDRVRQLAAAIPTMTTVSKTRESAKVEATSVTSGSMSMFYYGGKSDVRTQEFKDSVLGGLPVLQSDSTLSGVDQKLIQTNMDLNWRFRDAEKDMRFVFRDAYSADLMPRGVNKERLSALYFDYRSLVNHTNFRVGRQSPNGGGVLYRFDGIQAGYAFKPKWKVNAVVGTPSDPLLDTQRTFYGLSVDADALTKQISGSVFLIEQTIDGEIDRRGIGADLRYFRGGISATAQLDYDQILKAVNIAAFQSTWQLTESTVLNAMFDRRTTPIMTLGNVLFFQDPALLAPAKRIQELLGTTPIETLREQAKGLTAYQTQARIGGTTSVAPNWQVGSDISLTSVDEIKPVAVLLPTGQPSTGNLWGTSAQLIGTNLYSARDTHVFNLSLLGGPTYHGTLVSYNNLSSLSEKWQLEPSLKYYTQSDMAGASNDTWTAGVRAIYRVRQQVSLETELTYESSQATGAPTPSGPGNSTSANRMNYYLGARYDF